MPAPGSVKELNIATVEDRRNIGIYNSVSQRRQNKGPERNKLPGEQLQPSSGIDYIDRAHCQPEYHEEDLEAKKTRAEMKERIVLEWESLILAPTRASATT